MTSFPRKDKTLTISHGRYGVMVHIHGGEINTSIVLSRDEVRMLWTDLGEMLGKFELAE